MVYSIYEFKLKHHFEQQIESREAKKILISFMITTLIF